MEGISVSMGAKREGMEEMGKGEVVCEDARYKMQAKPVSCTPMA